MQHPSDKIGACAHEETVSGEPQPKQAIDQHVHSPLSWANCRLLFNAIIIGLSIGLFGYDNSFAAPLAALPLFVAKYQGSGFAFTARNLNLIIAVPLVGAAMGTFVATPLMMHIGRKKTFLIAYFLFCTPGSILQVFSPNTAALVIGRFWNYLGVSILTTTAPLYLSELVPAHVRARSVGFCIAGASATGIAGTTTVWASERINNSRQYLIPLAVQAALPVAFGCLTLFCFESPLWDLQHDRVERARATLMALRGGRTVVVEAELAVGRAVMRANAEQQRQTRFWDILHPSHLKRTLTAGAMLSLGQVGGQILILTYSTVILVQANVANPFQVTIIISCLTFLGTVIGPVLVDKAGRRPVALGGFSILFILNMAAGGLAAAGLTTNSQRLGLAAVFIMFAFFNAASFQSLGYLLPTEVASPSLREPSVAWSVFWPYTTAIITSFAVPQIVAPDAGNLGAKAAFIFGGCVLLTTVWAWFYVPETKARTVAEIDELYKRGVPVWRWKGYQCRGLEDEQDVAANEKPEMVAETEMLEDAKDA